MKKFLLCGIVSVLCLTAVELSARWIYHHILPSNEALQNGRGIVELMAEGKTAVPQTIVSHPYMLYVNQPHIKDEFEQTNAFGYRNPDFPLQKDEGVFRILALGGSTTNMYPFIKDPKKTWTAQLEKRLNEMPAKKPFQVVNAGLPYATSAELLAGYVFRHRFLAPDLVIIHEAGNDVGPLLFENYDPEYAHFRAAANAISRPAEKIILSSYAVRLFYIYWLKDMRSVYREQPYSFQLLDRNAALRRVRQTEPVGFERNINYLTQLAKQDGAGVLIVGFIQAREEQLAKDRESLRGLERAIVEALEKNHAALRRVAAGQGVDFVLPDQDRFRDEWFQDNCHLNEEGEAMMASIVYDALLKDDRVRQNLN